MHGLARLKAVILSSVIGGQGLPPQEKREKSAIEGTIRPSAAGRDLWPLLTCFL